MNLRYLSIASGSLFILVITLFTYLVRAHISGNFYGSTDFFQFFHAMRFHFAGQNIYSPLNIQLYHPKQNYWEIFDANTNLNPPFFTFFLFPFYYLNYAQALVVWTQISFVLMFSSAAILFYVLPLIRQWWQTLAIIAAFFLYTPNSINLAYGQLGAITLFFSVVLWWSSRYKKDLLAGILLGIICNIKLFFGLFFIYFLVLRRWRLIISGILTYFSCFALAWYYFGASAYWHYRYNLAHIKWYAISWNISWLGEFTRWFSTQEGNIALWHLPWLIFPCTLLMTILSVGYLVYYSWKISKNRYEFLQQDLFDISFSLTLLLMLLLSPLGWLYYFGTLLLPYLILIQQLQHFRYGWLWQLTPPLLLFLSTLAGDLLLTTAIHDTQQILINSGMPFYALCGFMFLFMYILHKKLAATAPFLRFSSPLSHTTLTIIYATTLIPSIISLGYLWRNMVPLLSYR